MIESAAQGQRFAAGVLRPRDLAGKPLSSPTRSDRSHAVASAPRGSRNSCRAPRRAPAARPLRSRAGAAEIRRIPQRTAHAVRQSRIGRRGLQRRTAPGAGMACGLRLLCRRRRATTLSPLPAPPSIAGPPRARMATCRHRAPSTGFHDLMAFLKRAPNSFVSELEQHVKLGADRLWACTRRWLRSGPGVGDVFPRDDAVARRDRRSGSELAWLAVPQPRHPHILSGANRRRHAPRRRRSLQPYPPRRWRLSGVAEHERQGMIPAAGTDSSFARQP